MSRRGVIEGIVWVLTGIFVVMMFMAPVGELLRQLAREVNGSPP